jgi:glutamate decarboxylase
MLLRLGRAGYTLVQQASRDTARWLSARIAEIDEYELLSEGAQLPVFAFRLAPDVDGFSVYDVSEFLRIRGWIVPAYKMPPAIDDLSVLRICVRNGFSRNLAGLFLHDLRGVTRRLAGGRPATPPDAHRASFHH